MLKDLLPNLGKQTYIMGILNLTADSFSGDGLLQQGEPLRAALEQARAFASEGAQILDIGAESTRPGARPVPAGQELERLLPVLNALREELPDIILSVDTTKAAVAEEALRAGAHIINDVWGLRADPLMGQTAAGHNAGLVLMHNRSTPQNAALDTSLGGRYVDVAYDDVCAEVADGLRQSVEIAREAGVRDGQIMLDPGIGFGKTTAQNLRLLKELEYFKTLGFPLLLGVSRKSFIGYTLNLPPEERLEGSLAANAYGILHGADILRVHDVRQTARLAKMLDAIRFA
ncbi:MAG TPA: dihydropteroate synthase [Anaerolineaceae bacterium]|jgi:dihydropteroate synthase|nr:dihydropteroate synthase [Anaerolineaceae bacterium]HOR83887.1 dihydropteroate synthase [Anaerolineaceae bacterium]HOT52831.1 dihydropteroate synthase [Anaerolineaceae bacterium]HPL42223.1 dihydropteroate synthase [Anaerolineaceae bacterium]HQC20997.1 dihydropteroate synthase [Anaerolineaceae bacterium]